MDIFAWLPEEAYRYVKGIPAIAWLGNQIKLKLSGLVNWLSETEFLKSCLSFNSFVCVLLFYYSLVVQIILAQTYFDNWFKLNAILMGWQPYLSSYNLCSYVYLQVIFLHIDTYLIVYDSQLLAILHLTLHNMRFFF